METHILSLCAQGKFRLILLYSISQETLLFLIDCVQRINYAVTWCIYVLGGCIDSLTLKWSVYIFAAGCICFVNCLTAVCCYQAGTVSVFQSNQCNRKSVHQLVIFITSRENNFAELTNISPQYTDLGLLPSFTS